MRRNPNTHADPELRDAVDVTRFWRLVDQRDSGSCWPWVGDQDRNGYGRFRWRGRVRMAHELALSFTTGEVRHPTLESCHSCDNPPCCNPTHLRFDTRQSNMADMDRRGRRNKASRLTPADVVLIRERRAGGARQKDLAAQYGLSDGQISMIVRGLRWPEIGGPIETERQYRRAR